jgi:hypothetical protein
MEESDFFDLMSSIRSKISKKAGAEIDESLAASLAANDLEHHSNIELVHILASSLNQSPLAILVAGGNPEKFAVIYGGARCSNEDADRYKAENLSPYWQLNLTEIGGLLGFKTHYRYLDICVSAEDWGQGVKVQSRLAQPLDVNQEASQLFVCDTEGFKFSEDQESVEFLYAELLGTGCLTNSLMETLDFEGVILDETMELCSDLDEENGGLADGILLSESFLGAAEADCFSAMSNSNVEKKIWLPLAQLSGPNHDLEAGIVDQYTVFHTVINGYISDVETFCHRWRY